MAGNLSVDSFSHCVRKLSFRVVSGLVVAWAWDSVFVRLHPCVFGELASLFEHFVGFDKALGFVGVRRGRNGRMSLEAFGLVESGGFPLNGGSHHGLRQVIEIA